MRFGDQLSDTLKRLGAPAGEIEVLRLEGNRLQNTASAVAGWMTPNGGLDLGFLPLRVLYSKQFSVDTPSVTVQIPSDVNNLFIFGMSRTDAANTYDNIKLQFNGDTGANYEYQEDIGQNALAAAHQERAVSWAVMAIATAATAAANLAGYWFGVLPNIHSSFFKGVLAITGSRVTAINNSISVSAAWHNSTDRLTSLTFTPVTGANFVAGSSITVVGIV